METSLLGGSLQITVFVKMTLCKITKILGLKIPELAQVVVFSFIIQLLLELVMYQLMVVLLITLVVKVAEEESNCTSKDGTTTFTMAFMSGIGKEITPSDKVTDLIIKISAVACISAQQER